MIGKSRVPEVLHRQIECGSTNMVDCQFLLLKQEEKQFINVAYKYMTDIKNS